MWKLFMPPFILLKIKWYNKSQGHRMVEALQGYVEAEALVRNCELVVTMKTHQSL
jgi:hypothetical protein